MTRKIDKIIIHCSATAEDKDYTVADIDRCHKARGFKSIGYHYVIYRDGSIHGGRPEDQVGAHCLGHNTNSIGICYIGGLGKHGSPKDTRTEAQRAALVQLITELKARFPNATIHGHNELTCQRGQSRTRSGYAECSRQCTGCEFAAKTCPCFNVQTSCLCDL